VILRGIIFTAATGLEANAITLEKARVRRRLLPDEAARAMVQRVRGGDFCVDGRFRANWPATLNGISWPAAA